MKIKSVEYSKSVTGSDDILYDGKFQIAFMGRSNVGKSSLINSLLKRKNYARTSSTPGKTLKMDFFLINGKYYFIDFPGYGYAKRSKERQEKIRKMMLWYIMYSEVKNRVVILIVDAKIGLMPFDLEMIGILREYGTDFILVANKADKIKGTRLKEQLGKMSRDSGVIPILYSSHRKFGHEILFKSLSGYIS